jgi:PAS domain S-box-containing protein
LPVEEDLAHLVLLSRDLVCIVSVDGVFRLVNPTWQLCLGWTTQDLVGRLFLDFLHPDDRAATAAELRGIADGGGSNGFVARFRGADGAHHRLRWKASFAPSRQAIRASARAIASQERLERELIEAGDRERERLGRELHDGLCQNLAGIAALSATLARKLAARNDPAHAAAAEITVLLQQTIGDARDLARGLNGAGLAQTGLAAALEVLAANVEALHTVTCAFACDRLFPRLDPTVETQLYRIAQEALSNAVAHGRGSRIDVSLRLRAGSGSLRIRDDGVGIPRGASASAGMGLNTMYYRARLIGGRLRARRAKPRGSVVACTFPLSPPRAKERRHAGDSL